MKNLIFSNRMGAGFKSPIFRNYLLLSVVLLLAVWAGCKKEPDIQNDFLYSENPTDAQIKQAYNFYQSNQNLDRSGDPLDSDLFHRLPLQWDRARVCRVDSTRSFVIVPFAIEPADTLLGDLIFYSDSCGISLEIWVQAVSNTFNNDQHELLQNGLVMVLNECRSSELIFGVENGEMVYADTIPHPSTDGQAGVDERDQAAPAPDNSWYIEYFLWRLSGGGGGSGGWGSYGGSTGGSSGTEGSYNNWSGFGGWGNGNGTFDPTTQHPGLNLQSTDVTLYLAQIQMFKEKYNVELTGEFESIGTDCFLEGGGGEACAVNGVLNQICSLNSQQYQFLSEHPEIGPILLTYLAQNNFSPAAIQNIYQLLEIASMLELNIQQVSWLLNNVNEISKINDFYTTHNQSESHANAAKAVALAYIQIMMYPDTNLHEFMDDIASQSWTEGDPLWDAMAEQIGILVQEALIDLIPGGTLVTVGPQAIQQFKEGDWMGGTWTIVTIALDESSRFFPPAKIANTAYKIYESSKILKKLYKALDAAKHMGDQFVLKLYNALVNRFGITEVKNRIEWLGLPNGAKLNGASASDFFEDLKSEFGAVTPEFAHNNNPVFKITEFPQAGVSIYMELYSNSGTGWPKTIGFYRGPQNATNFSQLDSSNPFKIRFDN